MRDGLDYIFRDEKNMNIKEFIDYMY